MLATKFAVAVQIMLLLSYAEIAGEDDRARLLTSARLGASVDTNPVVIRRITGQLARAGLVKVHRGRGGAELGQNSESITLADIWEAVYPLERRRLLPIHATPSESGPAAVSHAIVDRVFTEIEDSFRGNLGRIQLAALAGQMRGDPTLAPPAG